MMNINEWWNTLPREEKIKLLNRYHPGKGEIMIETNDIINIYKKENLCGTR